MMNDVADIASLGRVGFPPLPQLLPGASPGQQDAFSLDGAAAPQESGETLPAAQLLPLDFKILAAKIAAALQKNGKLPDTLPEGALEGIPADLAAKITALLQQPDAPASDKIKPALTSDLAGPLSLQIQGATPAPDNIPQLKIADFLEADKPTVMPGLKDLLDKIEAGASVDGDVEKFLAQLQAPAPEAPAALDPAVLRLFNSKMAELQLDWGAFSNDDLAQFKSELVKSLKEMGFSQPGIEHSLAALARFLRQGNNTVADKPQDMAAAIPPAPAAALPPAVLPETVDIPAKAAEVLSSRPTLPPEQAHAAAKAVEVLSSRPPAIPAKGDGALEMPPQDTPPRAASAPAPQPKEAPLPTLQPPSTAAAAPTPAPPAATPRAAAVPAPMVNLLAAGNGSFDAEGFGAEGRAQPQGLARLDGFLKPAVDAANAQNFTNYLTAARNMSGAAVTQMVSLHLQRNISARTSMMTLELQPADLGRLDIKLKFDKEGGVKAHLSVEKPETLALLQRDAHHLERVLQQAGLDFDENALSFDLRQQNRQHDLEGFGGNKGKADEFSAHINGAEKALQAKIAVPAGGAITPGGVNIMV